MPLIKSSLIPKKFLKRQELKKWYSISGQSGYKYIHDSIRPSEMDVKLCAGFLKHFKEKKHASIEENTYESALGIFARFKGKKLGKLAINFGSEKGKRILFIDAIQGKRLFIKSLGRRFEEKYGLPWPNYLIRKAIETARKAGFTEVRLIRPEENPYYKKTLKKETSKELKKRQKRIRELYYTIARKEGFKKVKGKKHMVLKL